MSKTTAPNTPARDGGVAPPELKSTPLARGSATVSENISTVGTKVKNVSPWLFRDVETHRTCEVDTMMAELAHRCRDTNKPDRGKSALFRAALEAVLPICNNGKTTPRIKEYLTKFADATDERTSYPHFVGAVNTALLALSEVDVAGMVSSKDDNDRSDILFHYNDLEMYQTHQGEQSTRKPDIVVVSEEAAQKAQEDSDLSQKFDVYLDARKKPEKNFQWRDVHSTWEFKRSKRDIGHPPTNYKPTPQTEPKYMEIRKEVNAVQPTVPVPAPVATSSQRSSNQQRHSERIKKANKKRTSDNLDSSERSNKRVKSSNDSRRVEDEGDRPHPAVQNGLYVAEMFAAHIARQHVISCIVNNDIIYIWYFDRQDAIQCSGFNFIQDLPRLMVLLLIMQRMRNVDWGLNPLFDRAADSPSTIRIADEELGTVDLEFDLEAEDRTTHYGLRGRATNVFPVKSARLSKVLQKLPSQNTSSEMVAKIFWPEESRENEPAILKKVQEIAERHPNDVKGHIPEMVWFHKFDETSTATVRKALGIDEPERGSRVLYIIVFRKLMPITMLSGKDFLRAWWDVVICHRILWKFGIHHRDISPSNLMVYKAANGKWIGVLNDYDLSSTRLNGPSGNERTGTIPFMAIQLLEGEAIEGKVEHLYQHDAESLIWVLTWVCLRYEDGNLRSDRPLDVWLKQDANGCREKKTDFMFMGRKTAQPSSSHVSHWELVQSCLIHVGSMYMVRHTPTLEDEYVYKNWLEAEVALFL